MKEKYKQSETITISRSKVNFAPYNPKNHSKEQVKQIKDNIKKIGILGGIIWNESTGNLIDGHKRCMALDLLNKYDGTKDYEIKVEKIVLTEKEEKEQNIFQSKSKTEVDFVLLADIISDIDLEASGITQEDIEIMKFEVPDFNFTENTEAKEDIRKTTEQKQISKERLKAEKAKTKGKTEAENYVTLTFDSFESKAFFMERFGYDHYQLFIIGEELDKRVEIID